MNFLKKMKGTTQSPPRVGISEAAWSWLGAFLGISLVGLVQSLFVDQVGQGLLIGSFGATAVLVYGAIRSPLAQPRNVLAGMFFRHLLGYSRLNSLEIFLGWLRHWPYRPPSQ